MKRFLCASYRSPCVRAGRTAALQGKKMFVPFKLPSASKITYETLAGSQVAGDPDAMPPSSRCRAGR